LLKIQIWDAIVAEVVVVAEAPAKIKKESRIFLLNNEKQYFG